MKLSIEKIRIICFGIIFLLINMTSVAFATEFEIDTNAEYRRWSVLLNDEKNSAIMPRASSTVAPLTILNRYKTKSNRKYSMLDFDVNGVINIKNPLGASFQDSKFNLADYLTMRVENQGNTNECWAFSSIKALETNIALANNEKVLRNFSERHMDYSLSQSFYDGKNNMGLERQVQDGGLPISALAYLINGQGAVLETDMPFENNTNKIYLKDIDKDVNTIVTDYKVFPNIDKQYVRDVNGNTISVKYYDGNGVGYTDEELRAVRNMIKDYIVNNSAIISMNGGNYVQFYNNHTNPFKATTYNCNDSTKVRDHAITIVGWDDNYSKDNFANGAKPSTDGAYIALNSYGSNSFDNGYIYISYEDKFIEEEMYGITASKEKDYENIYQYDTFGGVFKMGKKNLAKGYFANKFTRNSQEVETLKSIGITIPIYASVNIYVNPINSEFNKDSLVKVASTSQYLEPGYHRLDINPIDLVGKEFAVVVEQIGQDGTFYFSVEASQDGTSYKDVNSENRSFISLDFNEWVNLKDTNAALIDTSRADVCIKAFTNTKKTENEEEQKPIEENNNEEQEEQKPVEENNNEEQEEQKSVEENNNEEQEEQKPVEENNNEEQGEQKPVEENNNQEPENTEENNNEQNDINISSNLYKIDEEKYIMNVDYNTTIKNFLTNINTNSDKVVLKNENIEINNNEELVKTGMKIVLSNNVEYVIIVKGDIKEDGKLTLTDLSKLILHYNETEGFELVGNRLKAADMNLDGEVSLVDISKMVKLYNEI